MYHLTKFSDSADSFPETGDKLDAIDVIHGTFFLQLYMEMLVDFIIEEGAHGKPADNAHYSTTKHECAYLYSVQNPEGLRANGYLKRAWFRFCFL